jgi:hypothetical protein
MSHIIIDEYWLTRAEEARADAKQQTDPCAKERMLGIADSYQRRAHCDWSHPVRTPAPVRMH